MFKSDILFTGYYGQKNTGDDAFVEVASWGAEEYWNKKNNRFLAIESNLPKVLNPIKGYPFEIKRTYSAQAKFLLKNTDAFVYAGGSTIHSKLSERNIRNKAVQRKINDPKFKFGAIGVSIGPFKTLEDEKAVKSYLRQMDFLAVRDQTSFDFANSVEGLSFKPVNAFDLAALLPEIYKYERVNNFSGKKIIGISVCPYESLQNGMDIKLEHKRNQMLIDLLRGIDEKENVFFRFFVFNGHDRMGDLKLTKEIIARSNPRNFEIYHYNKETKKTWKAISACDFVLSTRLHAAIFACFANVPFLLNEYHRKCGDFLDNVGYQKDYRIYNSQYDIQETANFVLEIINKREKYIFPTYLQQMKRQASLNFSEIEI